MRSFILLEIVRREDFSGFRKLQAHLKGTHAACISFCGKVQNRNPSTH